MKLKVCPSCKTQLTTKNVYSIGRNQVGLWLNCKKCNSTILLGVSMNNKGFSMVSVMVAFGLMGLLMSALADMAVLMAKNNQTAKAESDMIAYTNMLRMNLMHSDKTTNMLKGNPMAGNIIVKDSFQPTKIIAQANHKEAANDAWLVKKISLENSQQVKDSLYKMQIVMITEKDAKRTLGSKQTRRSLGDVYCFVKSGKIESCNGPQDPVSQAKASCLAQGSEWVDANSFGTQCKARNVASEKGDHNNDGHPDNGQGHSKPCNK